MSKKLLQYYRSKMDVGGKVLPKYQSTGLFDPRQRAVAESTSNPNLIRNVQANIAIESLKKNAEAEKRKKEAEYYAKKALANQATIGPGPTQIQEVSRRIANEQRAREEALQNSALSQTMGLFTPSGYNPGAGASGAETFVNMAPIISPITSSLRLGQFGKGQNPYGFNKQDILSGQNALASLGLLGDVASLGSVKLLSKPKTTSPVTSVPFDEKSNLDFLNKLNEQEFKDYVSRLTPKQKNILYGLDPVDIDKNIKSGLTSALEANDYPVIGTRGTSSYNKNNWYAIDPEDYRFPEEMNLAKRDASEYVQKNYLNQGDARNHLLDLFSRGSANSKVPSTNSLTRNKLSILTDGNYLKSDLVKNNQISYKEILKARQKQIDWLRSEEYLKRRSQATGESIPKIQKDVENIISKGRSAEIGLYDPWSKSMEGSYLPSAKTIFGTRPAQISINNALTRDRGLSALTHEDLHNFSQLGTTRNYSNYPRIPIGKWYQRILNPHARYLNLPYEQQVRGLKLLDFIEETQGIPRGTKLKPEDIDLFARNVRKNGPYAQKFLDEHIDVADMIDEISKFNKGKSIRPDLLKFLNNVYTPAGVLLGAGTLGNNLIDSESIYNKKQGGPIVSTQGYKQGPPPQGNHYRIPSDTLYNPTPYKIKAVANTGQVKYLNPFDESNVNFPGADYVDEFPIMQKGGSLPQYQIKGEVAPIYVDNPKDPRLRAYNDSLSAYNIDKAWEKFIRTVPEMKYTAEEMDRLSDKYRIPLTKASVWNLVVTDKNGIRKVDYRRDVRVNDNQSRRYYSPVFAKPKRRVEYRAPQPVTPSVQQPVPPAPLRQYSGSPVYSPGAGSGMGSALIGFRSDKGDTTYIQPEDYQRFAVPKYAQDYLMSLDKKQVGGENEEETLVKTKKVGTVTTPGVKLNLRPIYYNFQDSQEDVYDPSCPDGVGCSRQATNFAQKITKLPRLSYAPADAGFRDAVAERYGLQRIFDQEGKQQKDADSRSKGWKFPTVEDYNKWKAGDIVTLDAGEDYLFPYSAPPGFKESDNTNLTHNGIIKGFTEDGTPIIQHGYETGSYRGRSYSEVLGKDKRVRDLGHGRYAIKSVWRPREIGEDNTINKVTDVYDYGTDIAKRKKNTTSNQSFYLKNPKEQELVDNYGPAAEFSGAANRLQTKQKLIDLFNNEELDKELQYKLGLTADEVDNMKPVIYGVFGQETNFNDIDHPYASAKETLGSLLGVGSRGPAQIKMSSLTKDEKKIIGIKKGKDLEKDENAYKAAMVLLNNARLRMNKEVKQGTHPELADKDEYFRAGYYYNSPARAINTAKDWGESSKPVRWYNPATWLNPLSTRERPGIFADVDPTYAQRNELRMDPGSYAYKLMEQARDLGVDVDFDKGQDLEEVVVRGAKKGSTLKKEKDGGSLDRTVTCSSCGWSWKFSDGGKDPVTCHKCGGQIKMKNGGPLPKYQTAGWVQRAADANLNFWEKCGLSQSAGSNNSGGVRTIDYDDMQKQLWKERTDPYAGLKGEERRARKAAYQEAAAKNPGLTPEMFAMADWDAWSYNSGLKNYGKMIDPSTGMIPDSVVAPSQFKYFINNKLIQNTGKPATYADMLNIYNQLEGGFEGGYKPLFMSGYRQQKKHGGQHGGLDRWFAEKWVDVKTGKACGRQEGESRAGYPACRPSKRVSSKTPKTSSEMSSAEKTKFKQSKTSSKRIPYNHKRK